MVWTSDCELSITIWSVPESGCGIVNALLNGNADGMCQRALSCAGVMRFTQDEATSRNQLSVQSQKCHRRAGPIHECNDCLVRLVVSSVLNLPSVVIIGILAWRKIAQRANVQPARRRDVSLPSRLQVGREPSERQDRPGRVSPISYIDPQIAIWVMKVLTSRTAISLHQC
ncbi:hypothetical protein LA080_006555 [Diaporthe eres]|nr:hypothetical protein LA080_006555 [Diaporthe eres]